MPRLARTIVLLAAVLLANSAAGSIGAPVGDASVKKRLDDRSLKYKVYEDGDFKLTFSSKQEGRSQLVFVSGKTESIGSLEIREVFAPALNFVDFPLSGEKAKELLESSGKLKLGSWEIRNEVLYYVIKIPDSINAEELETLLEIAALAADNMELELSGKDNL